MGNCFAASPTNKPLTLQKKSSLSTLNDSRHVMMKRTSMRAGLVEQKDGSFYRPRDENVFATIPEIGESEATNGLSDDTTSTRRTSTGSSVAEQQKPWLKFRCDKDLMRRSYEEFRLSCGALRTKRCIDASYGRWCLMPDEAIDRIYLLLAMLLYKHLCF